MQVVSLGAHVYVSSRSCFPNAGGDVDCVLDNRVSDRGIARALAVKPYLQMRWLAHAVFGHYSTDQ